MGVTVVVNRLHLGCSSREFESPHPYSYNHDMTEYEKRHALLDDEKVEPEYVFHFVKVLLRYADRMKILDSAYGGKYLTPIVVKGKNFAYHAPFEAAITKILKRHGINAIRTTYRLKHLDNGDTEYTYWWQLSKIS